MIGGHQLEIELEDIHFLIGFSRRGKPLSLFGARLGGRSVSSLELEFCNDEANP